MPNSKNFQGEIRIVYYTNQYNEICDFYKNVIGLEIFKTFDHNGEYERGIVFFLGEILVEILETKDEIQCKNDSYLYIETKEVNNFFDKIKDHVTVISSLESFPWGHTSFLIQDPDGNKLKFFTQN